MSQVNSVGAIASSIDLGATGSLQLLFARLQLALSETAKQSAMGYIENIQSSQDEQKMVSDMLQKARQLQADAASNTKNHVSAMPADMKDYMDKNGLAYDKTGNDQYASKDEWEVAITSLKARLDQIGTNTQQQMVFVQDFMGQYNSYLQGANSAIQQSNQTLSDLARLR